MTFLRSGLIALILWLLSPTGIAGSDAAAERDHSGNARARLAIIIDDIGYSAELGERSLALPGAFTFALLPRAPHSPRLGRLGARKGKEIMLHTPMSNTRGLPLDAGALRENMTRSEFFQVLDANLDAIPQARGLNNHMGSLLTQKVESMGWLMEFLQERRLYFIDSRTSAKTRAHETARLYRVPSRSRDVFLDHNRDPDRISRQIDRAIALARQRGEALAIGHPYPETLTLLERLGPRLKTAGVSLVAASELVSLPLEPGHAQSHCPAPPQTLQRRPHCWLVQVPDPGYWGGNCQIMRQLRLDTNCFINGKRSGWENQAGRLEPVSNKDSRPPGVECQPLSSYSR